MMVHIDPFAPGNSPQHPSHFSRAAVDPEPLVELPPPADEVADGYENWAYADLQSEAKRRGLKASGTAPELIGRLAEADEAEAGHADPLAAALAALDAPTVA